MCTSYKDNTISDKFIITHIISEEENWIVNMKKKVSHTANESTDSDNESSTVSVWRCSPLVPPRLCKWILGAHCSPLCTTWSDGSGLPYSPEQGRKLLLSFCLLLCINSVWWFALCLVLSMLFMVMTECRHGDRQYIYTFYQSEFERLLFFGFERLLFFVFFFKIVNYKLKLNTILLGILGALCKLLAFFSQIKTNWQKNTTDIWTENLLKYSVVFF